MSLSKVLYLCLLLSTETALVDASVEAQCLMQLPDLGGLGNDHPKHKPWGLLRQPPLQLLDTRIATRHFQLPEVLDDMPLWMRASGALLAVIFTAGLIWACTASMPEGPSRPPTAFSQELDELEAEKRSLEAKKLSLEQAIGKTKEQGEPEIPDDDLRAKVDQASLDMSVHLKTGLKSGVMAAAPAFATAQRVKRVVEGRFEDAKTKATEHVAESGMKLIQKIMHLLGLDDSFVTLLGSWTAQVSGLQDSSTQVWEKGSGSSATSTPPASLVFAGLFAPMRLRIFITWHSALLALTEVLLLLLVGVMVFDTGLSCGSNVAWYWAGGMAGILFISALCRIMIINISVNGLRNLRHEDQSMPDTSNMKSFVEGMRARVMASSVDFFQALAAHDHASNCAAASLQNLLSFVLLVYTGFSVHWSIWYVVEDDTCDARSLQLTMHIFAFLYVLLFIWALVFFAMCLGMLIAQKMMASSAMLTHARKMDSELCFGLPVISMFVRVFFSKNVLDLVQADKTDVQESLDEFSKKQETLQKESVGIDSELATKEQKLEAATRERMEEESLLASRIAAFSDRALSQDEQGNIKDEQGNIKDMALQAIQAARDAGVDLESLAVSVTSQGLAGQSTGSGAATSAASAS